MRDYIRGLLGPVGRKNGWQLAEYAGHRTPDRLQRFLNSARWDADELRDDLQHYVAERLGEPEGILILDDTGFLKKAPPACSASTPAPLAAPRTARSACSPPDRGAARERDHRPVISPLHSPKPSLTRENSEVQLEY
jgi:hypothetical protein